MLNLNPLAILQISILLFLPMMFIFIWLLLKLMISNRYIKVISCAGVITIFILITLGLIDNAPFLVKSQKTITILVVIFWEIVGIFIGAYYDVRLRVERHANYYNEVLRFRTQALMYAIPYTVFCIILGLVTGWMIITFGFSISGILFSIMFGTIYGGLLGIVLDIFSNRNNSP